jgi:hypothetical protein
MEMPVTSRRPPLPPLVYVRFPEYASFSVLRETPVPFSSHHFKKLKCYTARYQGYSSLSMMVATP